MKIRIAIVGSDKSAVFEIDDGDRPENNDFHNRYIDWLKRVDLAMQYHYGKLS